MIDSASKRRSAAGFYVRTTGGPPPDPNTIVKTAGGNWNDENLQPGMEANVQSGLAFGLSQTGTGPFGIKLAIFKTT